MTAEPITHMQAVAALVAAAPPGQADLSEADLEALRAATARLVSVSGGQGLEEMNRFLATFTRGIAVDQDRLRIAHAGRVVVVTGGTGCIGSEVVRQILALGPRRVISISRGLQTAWPRFPGVEYVNLDIRDGQAVLELIRDCAPDIVYHLAAQHDPGLAEREVQRTLSTNVTGTVNIVQACRLVPGVRLACASTGKALRPFTRDIYCASKKITEWVLGEAAAHAGLSVSAVRFTHVVNNSIILRRLQDWTAAGTTIRLHDLEAVFYLQSATEAAQLLMSSVLDAVPGRLAVAAIRDLGWPVSLLDLAVGAVATQPTDSALYWCGIEAGYEKAQYPGLYDPKVSGSLSPLFNGLESHTVQGSSASTDIDVYQSSVAYDIGVARAIDEIGAGAVSGTDAADLRDLVADCGWAMLRCFLARVPRDGLVRHLEVLDGQPIDSFSADDLRIRSMVVGEHTQRAYHPGVATHFEPEAHGPGRRARSGVLSSR